MSRLRDGIGQGAIVDVFDRRFAGRVEGCNDDGIGVAEASGKLAEEIPDAYKEVGAVVDVVDRAGIARKVARLRPLAVVKG